MKERVYLAGPDVFRVDAREIAAAKERLCSEYGLVGITPIDTEGQNIDKEGWDPAVEVSRSNEAKIRSCHAVIADLTPFRGPSADVGTAYEMGLARGLGIPVFGYTNISGSLLERLQLDGLTRGRLSGQTVDTMGLNIEDYGLSDNLMLIGALRNSGTKLIISSCRGVGRYSTPVALEECLRAVQKRFQIPPF